MSSSTSQSGQEQLAPTVLLDNNLARQDLWFHPGEELNENRLIGEFN